MSGPGRKQPVKLKVSPTTERPLMVKAAVQIPTLEKLLSSDWFEVQPRFGGHF